MVFVESLESRAWMGEIDITWARLRRRRGNALVICDGRAMVPGVARCRTRAERARVRRGARSVTDRRVRTHQGDRPSS
jgi:hypothetical protein